jgi:hypothetical protein
MGLVLVLATGAASQDLQPDQSRVERAGTPKPVLAIDKVLQDFGEVRPGKGLRWAFKFRNVGNADLLITGLGTT